MLTLIFIPIDQVKQTQHFALAKNMNMVSDINDRQLSAPRRLWSLLLEMLFFYRRSQRRTRRPMVTFWRMEELELEVEVLCWLAAAAPDVQLVKPVSC